MKFNSHKNVDPAKTFVENLTKSRSIFKSLFKTLRLSSSGEYDAILSDFEISTCLAGFFLRKPVIVIDHQHSLIHPGALRAPGKKSDIFNVVVALAMTVPYFSHIFALDLVNMPIRRHRQTLFPLIRKPELDKYITETENNDHFCVYLPYIEKKQICRVFSQFPREKFFVYGFNFTQRHKNIIFKETSRTNFLIDMASSKGVMGHSGFSLSWETMLFKKPFYTIPLQYHWEQQSNAYRLKQLNLAYVADDLSVKDVERFLDQAYSESFSNHGKINILEPNVLTNCIYKEIAKA
ncbi:MAG: hypothetical protein BAJALOKI1v1_760001 [Promethearchaeota archaeon]|nr:MAG: hypothetical protein BAJALOKI1v1_760001 [Candidatus Lokiarchaeota archaeon]